MSCGRGGFGAGGGPRGGVFGDEPAPNGNGPVPNGNGNGAEEPSKPISAVELAVWGLLAGAGVGLVVHVATRKKGMR